MEEIKIRTGLGVVDTIYEDEEEYYPSSSLSASPVHSPASTPISVRVEAWSLATGHEADVGIHVQNSTFCLHKDPLSIRSGYLRRQLKGVTQFTLPPQLKITAETFKSVAEFCYGASPLITPSNVAPLRIAAELLEMTEAKDGLGHNLRQKTEDYFRRAASANEEYGCTVLKSSLSLLPEAETRACLVSRCIEALSLSGNDNSIMKCLSEVSDFRADDFELVVEALNQRLTGSHDLLYAMVDHYLKEHNDKFSEEKKSRMCNYIDCTSLSPQLLMHAVQNPRMPLRFVVQAMIVEQLNTRRSIVSAATHRVEKHQQSQNDVTTLGAILQRDAALRQVAQLKAAMNATSSRIESLEEELRTIRERLHESSSTSGNNRDSRRSASFRFSSEEKIRRGQIGSVSSGSLRFFSNKERVGGTSSSENSYVSPRMEKGFSRRLIKGVKSAFRLPNLLSKKNNSDGHGSILKPDQVQVTGEDRNEDVLVIRKDIPFQKRCILKK